MNCDPIARWYRWFEYIGFGGALERRRFAFLPDITNARRVLVLGEGDGRFLAQLVRQNRGASIDYVDLSARMLDLARSRAGDGVRYIHGDALTVPLADSDYDLIVTHFFLDCFNGPDQAALVERITRAAHTRSQWLISEFRQPAGWARAFIRMLYLFFRITAGLRTTRLSDHRPLLEAHGFKLMKEERARAGLLVSELWAFERQ